jgi:acyl-CoA thioesterase-1
MAALALGGTVAPVAAAAGPVTIAALGDSLTHGYGLPPEQGFVPQLQAWLRAQGLDVTVLNAGVSGDTTAGGLARLDWTLTPEVDALIVELGANDFLRGIDPAAARANLDAILTRAGEAGIPVLLIGLPAPANYGPEYKQQFDAIWPDLAAKHGTLLVSDFFRGLVPPGADPAAERAAVMQPDGIHPNAVGVARIVADVGPDVAALVARVQP